MDNDINFIDLDGLKKFLGYPVINFIEQHLYQKFGGRRSDYPWGAIVNPHATLGSEDHNLRFNLETGYWIDRSTGDSGADIISLFSYLYRLSPNKAALRIIEEMRLSHG